MSGEGVDKGKVGPSGPVQVPREAAKPVARAAEPGGPNGGAQPLTEPPSGGSPPRPPDKKIATTPEEISRVAAARAKRAEQAVAGVTTRLDAAEQTVDELKRSVSAVAQDTTDLKNRVGHIEETRVALDEAATEAEGSTRVAAEAVARISALDPLVVRGETLVTQLDGEAGLLGQAARANLRVSNSIETLGVRTTLFETLARKLEGAVKKAGEAKTALSEALSEGYQKVRDAIVGAEQATANASVATERANTATGKATSAAQEANAAAEKAAAGRDDLERLVRKAEGAAGDALTSSAATEARVRNVIAIGQDVARDKKETGEAAVRAETARDQARGFAGEAKGSSGEAKSHLTAVESARSAVETAIAGIGTSISGGLVAIERAARAARTSIETKVGEATAAKLGAELARDGAVTAKGAAEAAREQAVGAKTAIDAFSHTIGDTVYSGLEGIKAALADITANAVEAAASAARVEQFRPVLDLMNAVSEEGMTPERLVERARLTLDGGAYNFDNSLFNVLRGPSEDDASYNPIPDTLDAFGKYPLQTAHTLSLFAFSEPGKLAKDHAAADDPDAQEAAVKVQTRARELLNIFASLDTGTIMARATEDPIDVATAQRIIDLSIEMLAPRGAQSEAG
ncbi:hypothetical protein HY988_05810 [Candidatus Micrarchaeota archaeon]|nr:hypothetical protein [Candidatus Micrarchaeota archaeon]